MAMPKIDTTSFLPPRQAEAYAKSPKPPTAAPSTAATEGSLPVGPHPSHGDRAEISAGARDLVDLRASVDAGLAAFDGLPDVRAERVAVARERVASGYYQSSEVQSKTAERLKNVLKSLDSL
jgi:hypothetical protein